MNTSENTPIPRAEAGRSPLVSEFADDAEMAELIEYFLTELSTHAGNLERAWLHGDQAAIRKLAHQLKGAAGGYGFPTITDTAADVEMSLEAEVAELSAVAEKVEALITMCRQAAASAG